MLTIHQVIFDCEFGESAMPESEKVLSDFMADKNKEALGEANPEAKAEDDNYLPDDKLALSSFSEESTPKNEKAVAIFYKTIRIALMVPLILGTIFIALYFLMKIGPSFLFFIRNFFVSLTKV